jgi:hypothetical protein
MPSNPSIKSKIIMVIPIVILVVALVILFATQSKSLNQTESGASASSQMSSLALSPLLTSESSSAALFSSSLASSVPLPLSGNRFNSKYFTLSFDVPEGFSVEDGPNHIGIAAPQSPGPYETIFYFMELWRYTGTETQAGEIEDMRDELKNIVQDTVSIDGTSFVRLTGNTFSTINGKIEIHPGKISYIFFEKSKMTIFGGHPELTGGYDPFTLADQILSTMTFSSNAH